MALVGSMASPNAAIADRLRMQRLFMFSSLVLIVVLRSRRRPPIKVRFDG
jgi:hypothetical protein